MMHTQCAVLPEGRAGPAASLLPAGLCWVCSLPALEEPHTPPNPPHRALRSVVSAETISARCALPVGTEGLGRMRTRSRRGQLTLCVAQECPRERRGAGSMCRHINSSCKRCRHHHRWGLATHGCLLQFCRRRGRKNTP